MPGDVQLVPAPVAVGKLLRRAAADRFGEADDHRERDESRDELVPVGDRCGNQDQQDRQCIDAKARSTDGMDIADAISQVDSGLA